MAAKMGKKNGKVDSPLKTIKKKDEKALEKLLVEHDVPKKEIERAGGAGGFLSKFLGNLQGGKFPLLKKLIETLITAGISGLSGGGGSGGGTPASTTKAKDMDDDDDDGGDDDCDD